MIREFCAENFTRVPHAIAAGATRIELCDNLAVGGTTPSLGVIEATCRYAANCMVPVMVMIRPRGGNFVYTDSEVAIMKRDVDAVRRVGAAGAVLGCLTGGGWIDEPATTALLRAASGLQVTFHMAFDDISSERQFAAIDWLAEHGVSRVLTHGGPMRVPIEENIERLSHLQAYAKGRLLILPGGGITYANAEAIARKVGVQEVHGTAIVRMEDYIQTSSL